MLQGNKLLTSFFKKSQERPSLSRPTPHAPYNFHQATDRKRKAGSEVLSVVEEQQVSQDGVICKIRFLVDHVFFIIITIIIIIFLFAIMTLKYKKRKKYRKHTKRERGQKEKKIIKKITQSFNQRT